MEALSQDEEIAEELLDEIPVHVERISIWSPEREVLAAIYDRLGNLLRVTVAASNGIPPDLDPFPRPVTAHQRLRAKRDDEQYESLVERLIGR